MDESDRETLVEIYTRLQSQPSPERKVGYEDILQQVMYFEILASIGIPPDSTILDVGCGRGDLYAYLLSQGFKGNYTGVDIMPEFIAEGKERFPKAEFIEGDIVSIDMGKCDYVLAAGPFDYRTPCSLKRWKIAIARMFASARKGIAWNGFASIPEDHDRMWAQPLPAVIEMCLSLSPYYSIRSDYDPVHFTAFVYRREHFYTSELHALIGHLFLHPDYVRKLRKDPLGWAGQFGVSLQQIYVIESLWV